MAGLVGNRGDIKLGRGPKGLEAGLEGGLEPDPSRQGETGELRPPEGALGLSKDSMQID